MPIEFFDETEVLVLGTAAEAVGAAADLVVRAAPDAVRARGCFTLALAGGSTPRDLYAALAAPDRRDRIDWARVHLFWGDERCVPPDHAESNFRMARESLVDHVPVPPAHVHRIRGEDTPDRAAAAYESALWASLGAGEDGGPGALDLVLLGLGTDGHTASLFPGRPSGRETTRWVVADHVDDAHGWRVTLTVPVLNAARTVAFLVTGAGKAPVLAMVLDGPRTPDIFPAQRIRPRPGRLVWLVDRDAAALLTHPPAGR